MADKAAHETLSNTPTGGQVRAQANTLPSSDPAVLLSVRGLTKLFASVPALVDVDLDIRHGEVHALVGQNGSGKSTLIKILSGIYAAEEGSSATYNGVSLDLTKAWGKRPNLHVVHQDPGLILELSTVDNLALSSGFITRLGRVQWKALTARAEALLKRFELDIDVHLPLARFSPVVRAVVAIAFAVAGFDGGSGLLVLDEPTAILPQFEVEHLLRVVRRLRSEGVSVLYVSHRLDEIFEIADTVTVLKDGQLVTTRPAASLNPHSLASLMVGREVDTGRSAGLGLGADEVVVLEAEHLTTSTLQGVDLAVRKGEIVGVAGLPGSGAEDLLRVLSGDLRAHRGRLRYGQDASHWMTSRRIRKLRLPLVPADRLHEGVIAGLTVRENAVLSIVDSLGRFRLNRRREDASYQQISEILEIKAASPELPILSLSGGNQQKVVIGRCIAAEPSVLLLSEPTAGVDVGTRQTIYKLLRTMCDQGLSIIVTSSDSGDLTALCHRVLVIRRGHIVRELAGDAITDSNLITWMEDGLDDAI